LVSIFFVCAENRKDDDPGNVNFTNITLAIFAGLAGLMLLSSCYIICKYNTF